MPHTLAIVAKAPDKVGLKVYHVERESNNVSITPNIVKEIEVYVQDAIECGYKTLEVQLCVRYNMNVKGNTTVSREIKIKNGEYRGVLRRVLIGLNQEYIEGLGDSGLCKADRLGYMVDWIYKNLEHLDARDIHTAMNEVDLQVRKSKTIEGCISKINRIMEQAKNGVYRSRSMRYWVAGEVSNTFRSR